MFLLAGRGGGMAVLARRISAQIRHTTTDKHWRIQGAYGVFAGQLLRVFICLSV